MKKIATSETIEYKITVEGSVAEFSLNSGGEEFKFVSVSDPMVDDWDIQYVCD